MIQHWGPSLFKLATRLQGQGHGCSLQCLVTAGHAGGVQGFWAEFSFKALGYLEVLEFLLCDPRTYRKKFWRGRQEQA